MQESVDLSRDGFSLMHVVLLIAVPDISSIISALLDGDEACNDGEFFCPPSVDIENLQNMAAAKCIPETWRCDKQTDCDGGEDEENCE